MKYLAIAAAMTLLGGAAWADTGNNPDWPCIQRLQPNLSLAQVWSGPEPTEAQRQLAHDPAIVQIADRLEQRRLPIDQASAEIADYAKQADNDHLIALMVALFNRIGPDRSALIEGIGRYGHKQVELGAQIQARRSKMEELQAAEAPDFDAIDAEETALDWDTRIFTDRQQALTYVCETPVILEQRAFALGRAIAFNLHE